MLEIGSKNRRYDHLFKEASELVASDLCPDPDLNIIAVDARSLPFEEGSFDAVVVFGKRVFLDAVFTVTRSSPDTVDGSLLERLSRDVQVARIPASVPSSDNHIRKAQLVGIVIHIYLPNMDSAGAVFAQELAVTWKIFFEDTTVIILLCFVDIETRHG